jgi:hypothetical protein
VLLDLAVVRVGEHSRTAEPHVGPRNQGNKGRPLLPRAPAPLQKVAMARRMRQSVSALSNQCSFLGRGPFKSV